LTTSKRSSFIKPIVVVTSLILAAHLLRPCYLSAQAQPNDNTAILQEVERMRARIQQLEAELKAREAEKPAETAAAAASPAKHAPEDPAKETDPAVPPSAEPFAFADWTWLTGNPRTKESPLDTK